MMIKKILLTFVIVFALSFSFQSLNLNVRERMSVVFVLDSHTNPFISDFIKKNETRKFVILVSITMQCLVYSRENILFNTS
ncbi:MAG: hypothetical protein ABIY50_01125 [Ignavibacteria bacterium]